MKHYLLTSLLLLCSLAARAQTIHLNVHDGRTARPLPTLYIEVALFSDGDKLVRRKIVTIEPAGVDVITDGAQYIQVTGLGTAKDRMHEYGECDADDCKSGEGFQSARIEEVLRAGVISRHGRAAGVTSRPGTIDIYVHKISRYEKLLDRLSS